MAPRPASLVISGKAFDRPPAPTSWIDRMGLSAPIAQQALMTSCARRSISGLPRWTESKSRSARVAAGRHRRGGAAAHADAHARPAQLHQQAADRQRFLFGMRGRDVADAAGDHDGLVIAVHGAADILLVAAEIAAEVGPAEFIVEGGAAERAFDHDLQRRHDAVRLAIDAALRMRRPRRWRLGGVARVFPWLHRVGQHQVGDGEAGQAGLGLGAAAGRAFVADLAAGAGGRAGERRDRGRVVMGFHLHQDMGQLLARPCRRCLRPRRADRNAARLPLRSPKNCRCRRRWCPSG